MLSLSAMVVAAYVQHNNVPTADLIALIGKTHAALFALRQEPEPVPEKQAPAVAIRKPISADWIICLEDGKRFRSLRRHLSAVYNMTPEEYRAKWFLPHDYPMVAPSYAEARSALAKASGLGKKPKQAVAEETAASPKPRRRKAD